MPWKEPDAVFYVDLTWSYVLRCDKFPLLYMLSLALFFEESLAARDRADGTDSMSSLRFYHVNGSLSPCFGTRTT